MWVRGPLGEQDKSNSVHFARGWTAVPGLISAPKTSNDRVGLSDSATRVHEASEPLAELEM